MKTTYVRHRLLGSLIGLYCLVTSAQADTTNLVTNQIKAPSVSVPITNAVTPSGVIASTDEKVLMALTSRPEVHWVERIINNSVFLPGKDGEWKREEVISFQFPSLVDFSIDGYLAVKLCSKLEVYRPIGVLFPASREMLVIGLCLTTSW